MKLTHSPILFLSIIFALTLPRIAAAAGEEGYVIKPSDQIRTMVFGNPELNISAVVPPDGKISFPMAGEIYVLNRTADELSQLLKQKLSVYFKDPDVSVFVTAIQPLKVYVLGSVANAGAVDFKPGNRLTDYIADAGGFKREADIEECYVYPLSDTLASNIVNLKEILEEGKADLNLQLKPFDTVYIKEKKGFIFENWRDVGEFIRIITGIIAIYLWIDRI